MEVPGKDSNLPQSDKFWLGWEMLKQKIME